MQQFGEKSNIETVRPPRYGKAASISQQLLEKTNMKIHDDHLPEAREKPRKKRSKKEREMHTAPSMDKEEDEKMNKFEELLDTFQREIDSIRAAPKMSSNSRWKTIYNIVAYAEDPVFSRMIPDKIKRKANWDALDEMDEESLTEILEQCRFCCSVNPSVMAGMYLSALGMGLDACEAASFYAHRNFGTVPLSNLQAQVMNDPQTQLLLRRYILENGSFATMDAGTSILLRAGSVISDVYKRNKELLEVDLKRFSSNTVLEDKYKDLD